MDEGKECIIIQSADVTKLGRSADWLKDRKAPQRDLDKLHQMPKAKTTRFNMVKFQVLHLGLLGVSDWKIALGEKDLAMPADSNLNFQSYSRVQVKKHTLIYSDNIFALCSGKQSTKDTFDYYLHLKVSNKISGNLCN